MRVRHWIIPVVMGAMLIASCKSRADRDGGTPSDVMLEPQTGALLVQFPKSDPFDRETWMSQIQLDGDVDTRSLPRLPMADLQSTLVLNVTPGMYRVTAVAWTRKLAPTAGGRLDSVVVRPGQVTVLGAQAVGRDIYPFPATRLVPLAHRVWQLQRREGVQEYIADMIASTPKG